MSDYKADLIQYYPEFLQTNQEYNAICDAVNPEFDLLFRRLNELENNILPQTANSYGIGKYESWLGLMTNPYLDLDTRRAQVLAKLNETLPFTEIRLQRMLAAVCGWGHFHYERHGAFVKVDLDEEAISQSPVIYNLLKKILPLNLHFEVNCVFNKEEQDLSFAIGTLVTETIVTPIDNTDRTANVFSTGSSRLKKVIITVIDHTDETSEAKIAVAGRTIETIITEIQE